MRILVLNSGSSSIKYKLFDMADRSILASGLVERIGKQPVLWPIKRAMPGGK